MKPRYKRLPLAVRMEAWREKQKSQPETPLPYMTKDEFLKFVSSDAQLDFRVTLDTIYNETANYLQRLATAVNDSHSADEANNFLRWLQFSGVIKLLETNKRIAPKFLDLRKKASDLQCICQPFLRNSDYKPGHQSEQNDLGSKMDELLAMMRPKAPKSD